MLDWGPEDPSITHRGTMAISKRSCVRIGKSYTPRIWIVY
jgi:hypothetical protein